MEKNEMQRMVAFVALDAQQMMFESLFDGRIPQIIFCVSVPVLCCKLPKPQSELDVFYSFYST